MLKRQLYIIIIFGLLAPLGTGKAFAQSDPPACTCGCLKGLFDYLIETRQLFILQEQNVIVSDLVGMAKRAGHDVSYTECPLISRNLSKHFYALTTNSTDSVYKARIGDCTVSIRSVTGSPMDFYQLGMGVCENGKINYTGELIREKFPVTRILAEARSASLYLFKYFKGYPASTNPLAERIMAYAQNNNGPDPREYYELSNFWTIFAFDGFYGKTWFSRIRSAKVKLFAAEDGYYLNELFTPAHHSPEIIDFSLYRANWDNSGFPYYPGISFPVTPKINIVAPNKDYEFDAKPSIITWRESSLVPQPKLSFVMDIPTFSPSYGRQYANFYSQNYADSSKHPYLDVIYSANQTEGPHAILQADSCYTCTPVASGICYSAVTDTSVNPYLYGLAGNWRAERSYAYYANRTESDPTQATDIRKDGTIKDFASFWQLVSGTWKPKQDSTRWVWNSQITLFNRRGFELENKDPLGRYNAGLYGYDNALPVAVIQNSRYREAAFDGFEDYNFGVDICDTACPVARSFDFSRYKPYLDTTQQHTGRYSLRVEPDSTAGITVDLVAGDNETFELAFNKKNVNCITDGQALQSVRATKDALIPPFSPLNGKKVLVSAWVKEAKDCHCESYTGNQIGIQIIKSTETITVIAKPTGSIIEGWQRYEQVIDIPADGVQLSILLQATGTAKVYFDDVRVHPYHANMRSFVYSPQDLRLMAELDENNYATFYEYDDDGALIRVKKETSRGIKTIRETRNALVKEEVVAP